MSKHRNRAVKHRRQWIPEDRWRVVPKNTAARKRPKLAFLDETRLWRETYSKLSFNYDSLGM